VGSYYYFIAQLPSLSYGVKPPMSSDHFKALVADLLDGNDVKDMQYLSFDMFFKRFM